MHLPKPARKPFFYGWVIVAALAVNSGISIAMGQINFGFFIKPMGDELGISRATFGWAQSARVLTGAAFSPTLGRAIDRFGVRWLMPLAIVVMGAGMFAMSRVQAGWHMIVIYAAIGVVGAGGGQSLLNTVPVAKWFVHRRATATAMVIMGIPLGILVFGPVSEWLIDTYGWRAAWSLLGIIGIAITVPTSILLIRREPADIGLRPDGYQPDESSIESPTVARDAIPNDEVSWTRSEALRSSTFWRLLFVFSIMTLAQSTIGLHRIPNFIDKGLDPALVSYALSAESMMAICTSLLMGAVLQRFSPRYVGAAFILFIALSAVLNITGDNAVFLFMAFMTFGFGIQGYVVLQHYIWADYYGREHIGSIRGVMMPIMLIFSAIGPPGAGYIHDITGSYSTIWWFSAGMMVVASGTLALTARPRKIVASPVAEPELRPLLD